MRELKEIKLPSGAVLKISHTPFAESKALYQAVLEEFKGVKLISDSQMGDILKDIFCSGFTSKKIESALSECFKRCTYNSGSGDLKIDDSIFESDASREDYPMLCVEVIQANISPFMKGLFAGLKHVSVVMQNIL